MRFSILRLYYSTPLFLISLAITCSPAYATNNGELEQLKKQITALQTDYENRLQQLQKQVTNLEQQKNTQNNNLLSKPIANRSNQTQQAAPIQAPTGFNPNISAIINGGFNHYSLDSQTYSLPGFQRGNEAGLPHSGFGLQEVELNLQANIDPYFYGNITTALHQEGNQTEVELEEAFIRSQALPAGWSFKAGRFLSGIGYLNNQHSHNWDFVDAPLVYRALFNEQYRDDGIQLRWQLPTPFYWEIGVEGFSGTSFPAGGSGSRLGSKTLFTHIGGDIGENQSWQLGASYLQTKPNDRQALLPGADEDDADGYYYFSGRNHTYGLDAIWKWAPNGNAQNKQLILQGEIYQRKEDGTISLGQDISSLQSQQNGAYIEAIYKFLPRWRTGVRYDRLWSNNQGNNDAILAQTGLLAEGYEPHRTSAMLDYTLTEFSRFRLQYNRDYSLPQLNQQIMLQFIVNLGAHGAHVF